MKLQRELLAEDEPLPFAIEHERGASPFFLTCDHGGRRLPSSTAISHGISVPPP